MWEGAGLEGQVLVAAGFFTLQLEAFFSLALLQLLLCFNCLMNVLASSKSAELWSPSLQFEAPWKQTANVGSPCGNTKLQISSLTEQMQLMQNWDGQAAASRLECAEAAVREICSRRNSICCFSLLVADTCKWNLCHCSSFYASIWSSKSTLQKADINLKMQRTSLGTSSSALKINPGVWGDKDISLVLPELLHEQIFVSTNIKPSPFTPTQRGGSRRPGLNWDEHLQLQHPARSQCDLKCICPKFYKRNVF